MGIFFEIALWAGALLGLVYFIYVIFYSDHERIRRAHRDQHHLRRFERRQDEFGDRRKSENGAPPEGQDRRQTPRRRGDE